MEDCQTNRTLSGSRSGRELLADVAETGAVPVCLALNRLHECLCHTLLFSRMHCCHAPNEHVNRTVGNVCEVQNFAYMAG